MRIKFVFYPKKEGETVYESTYECDRFHFNEDPKNKHHALFDMVEGLADGKGQRVTFDKRTTDIFVMNDDGKTIDHYVWKYESERDLCIRS